MPFIKYIFLLTHIFNNKGPLLIFKHTVWFGILNKKQNNTYKILASNIDCDTNINLQLFAAFNQ